MIFLKRKIVTIEFSGFNFIFMHVMFPPFWCFFNEKKEKKITKIKLKTTKNLYKWNMYEDMDF